MSIRAEQQAVCLDITRLLSRVGRGPYTGIDRVEYAWLHGLLARDVSLFGFARTADGYVILERGGLEQIKSRIDGARPWGRVDFIGRASRRLSPARQASEADVRRFSKAWAARPFLGRLLKRALPDGALYLNMGHSNLNGRVLRAFSALRGTRVEVLIHDTIPVDYPEFHTPGIVAGFQARLQSVSKFADRIICNSAATSADVARHMSALGRAPQQIVSHLGVRVTKNKDGPAKKRDHFLAVGTLTPRKNVGLLLDIWDELSNEMGSGTPRLIMAGAIDDRHPDLAHRLRAHQREGGPVCVREGLSDSDIARLMRSAVSVLHPSNAEGFGYVPIEAALAETPVICADLPVYREVLGHIPVYADPADMYHWKRLIIELWQKKSRGQRAGDEWAIDPNQLTWDAHINKVLSLTR